MGKPANEKPNSRSKGIMMLEVIGAIFILAIGVTAAFALISRSVSSISSARERLIASYLAQEGIELVRNIRDTNWISGDKWDKGLTGCDLSPCQVFYNSSSLTHVYSGKPLNIESATGFYGYGPGEKTRFRRQITIKEPAASTMDVYVNVTWREKGITHSIKAEDRLRDWYRE